METKLHSDEKSGIEFRLISALEVIRRGGDDIVVDAGSQMELRADRAETSKYFHLVRLETVEDLQALGFVPRAIAEDELRLALRRDDAAALKLASEGPGLLDVVQGCNCGSSRSKRSPIREKYDRIRASHHPALADLLSDKYAKGIAWDDPIPALIRNWVLRLDARQLSEPGIIVTLLKDITVNRNAKLVIDPKSRSLLANNIWIHRAGAIVHQGASIHIWANAMRRFLDPADLVQETNPVFVTAGWKASL